MKKEIKLLILITFTSLTSIISHGQKTPIERIIIEDTVLFTLIDDYLQTIDNNLDTSGYIIIIIDPRSYFSCQECICKNDTTTSVFRFPINKNKYQIYRFGLSVVPEASTFIRDSRDFFKSMYLLRYKSFNFVFVSNSLTFDAKTVDDLIQVKYSEDGGIQRSFVNYDYELGVGIYKINRKLIFGKEY